MDILGKYVSRGKSLSPGLEELMWKMLRNQSLNSLHNQELRFLHFVLCHMYNLCLNSLLFRDAIANAGCRDDVVLSRKVPLEIWKLIYDGCVEMGVTSSTFQSDKSRGELWLYYNTHPRLLTGLTNYITQRLGLKHHVKISEHNLIDGNYLYSLGSVIPSRILMVIAFCLVNWGRMVAEPWIRLFSRKIFILFLLLSGGLVLNEHFLVSGYNGPVDTVIQDIQAMTGIVPIPHLRQEEASHENFLDFLFIFDNNMQI
ncbi:ORF18 [Felid gammaherpesvirus 1]|uniref:ORF18 n=1 Tax=Felid gammaherpesvirus 1 TaxID=2560468 RepID=A0A0M4LRR1_9GAMA|nr:ORF18 [Felis catus gammaherpesvirus 1]ALE14729.1 ORF18 [Felis catus gammaherpesvirus 1]